MSSIVNKYGSSTHYDNIKNALRQMEEFFCAYVSKHLAYYISFQAICYKRLEIIPRFFYNTVQNSNMKNTSSDDVFSGRSGYACWSGAYIAALPFWTTPSATATEVMDLLPVTPKSCWPMWVATYSCGWRPPNAVSAIDFWVSP